MDRRVHACRLVSAAIHIGGNTIIFETKYLNAFGQEVVRGACATLQHERRADPLLQKQLSRFYMAICPGFGTGIRPPGQKRWRLLSRVVEPGQNVPRAKKYLRPVGLEPKTYCLAHGLLANSSK